MPSRLRGFFRIVGLVLRDQPWRALGTTMFTVASRIAAPGFALGLKLLTDAANDGDAAGARAAGAVLAVCFGAWSLTAWASFSLTMGFRERSSVVLDAEVARLAATAHTLEHHERPDYLDEMTLLRQQGQRLATLPDALVLNVAVILQFVATVGLLGGVHPVLLLLPVAALPSIGLSALAERYGQRLQETLTPTFRLEGNLVRLARQADAGKELRVFGLEEELLRRYDELHIVLEREQRLYTIRVAVVQALGWLVFGGGFVAALILVANRAAQGLASPGDVVLALTLASQVNGQVTGLVQIAGWLVNTAKAAARYQWLADYEADQHALGHPADASPVPDAITRDIVFTGVGFRYPGTEVDVLSDVNLTLPSGSTVAVVGDNGAGKSTLVKLLCRFYDPSEGSITIDGVDLRDFDVDAWRDGMAGGFQDFAQFEFLASETVGVGDVGRVDDLNAIIAALERAHASDVADTLPSGMATQLGRSFDDGAELSTGQWQKLALGRAMMRERPRLLVLDEPTAAIDAPTEHALFERFAQAATRTAGITVFVSHRFSTVRMADIIVVVEGGRVTEVGSHSELMSRAGTYAELYELQASAYR